MWKRKFLLNIPSGQAVAPSLSDAGFESPALGAGNFLNDPAGTPWAYTGSAGVAGNGSGFTAGNPNAPEGTQVGFLQGRGSFAQFNNPESPFRFDCAQYATLGFADLGPRLLRRPPLAAEGRLPGDSRLHCRRDWRFARASLGHDPEEKNPA